MSKCFGITLGLNVNDTLDRLLTANTKIPLWQSLISGGLYLTGANIIQTAIGFGSNLLLLRLLTPEDFGGFAILLAKIGLIFSIFSFRTSTLIISATDAEFSERRKDLYYTVALIELSLIFIVSFFVLWLGNEITYISILLLMMLGLRHWTETNRAFFERSMHYKSLSVVETIAKISGYTLCVGAAYLGWGIMALVLRELITTVLGLLGQIWIKGITVRTIVCPQLRELKQMSREASGIWLDNILQSIFTQGTILVAGYIGGARVAGYFFQAQLFAQIPHLLLSSVINRVVFNWFSRIEETKDRRFAKNHILKLISLPILTFAIISSLLVDDLVPWLIGHEWTPVAPIYIGLFGFIIFLTPFEILRTYCIANNNLLRLNIVRSSMLLFLLLPIANLYIDYLDLGVALAVAQSLAYALAVTLLLIFTRR